MIELAAGELLPCGWTMCGGWVLIPILSFPSDSAKARFFFFDLFRNFFVLFLFLHFRFGYSLQKRVCPSLMFGIYYIMNTLILHFRFKIDWVEFQFLCRIFVDGNFLCDSRVLKLVASLIKTYRVGEVRAIWNKVLVQFVQVHASGETLCSFEPTNA